jgi:hypothetical protein
MEIFCLWFYYMASVVKYPCISWNFISMVWSELHSCPLKFIHKGQYFHEHFYQCNITKLLFRVFLLKICPILKIFKPMKRFRASVLRSRFYAAPAPGKNFDAAPAAPAPTLLYIKAKFLKQTKVYIHVETTLFIWFRTIYIAENMNWMGYKLLYFVSFFNS